MAAKGLHMHTQDAQSTAKQEAHPSKAGHASLAQHVCAASVDMIVQGWLMQQAG